MTSTQVSLGGVSDPEFAWRLPLRNCVDFLNGAGVLARAEAVKEPNNI